jgi:stage V sporulation protein R|tara:strand:- start:1393 stop:2775 length:1383 start_codon:yes stop_codon:yes gene_type:complete
MNNLLEKNIQKLEGMAEDFGLDFYTINYEVVPQEVMLEVISYGLPTRARHWSYGQSYDYQKMQGEMGFSKIYEVVLNNNPSYAFLLDTNTDIANTMVAAHVMGHVHFFKHNYLFKQTDRKMVYHAAERAQRIENYIEKHGIDEVEKWMDIGFALDKHIDWHKGVSRPEYPASEKIMRKKKRGEFEDMLGRPSMSCEEVLLNDSFPPFKEYDILWFLTNYSDMEPWKKDVFEIIRQESYYFYPQYMTKIMNEGFASFIHAELMYMFDEISPTDHIEFCKIHEKVVQPGGNKLKINPYFLGFSILKDVRKRWDDKKDSGESEIDGMQKIYQVVSQEDDISFLRNYLTKELVEELELFTYVTKMDKSNGKFIEIVSNDLEDVIESLTRDLYHYRAPLISISSASFDGIELIHESQNVGTLDEKHLERVMSYIFEVWGSIVNVESISADEEVVHYTYDELGFSG